MTFTKPSISRPAYTLTPQMRHFTAAEISKKAIRRHRQAARWHAVGDVEQAAIHANIARKHTVAA